jgi:hypothetical protein
MRIAVALLTVAVVALGQDCRECPSASGGKAASKATPTLSARIAKLEANAAKGCQTSETKLAALCKAAGAKDLKELKTRVAAWEEYAPCGCDVSKKKLADLTALLAPEAKPVVSGRVSVLLATAAQGDPKSRDLLNKLCDECCPQGCCEECGKDCGEDCGKDCGKECGDKLIGQIRTLEGAAANGCGKSAAKLSKMEAVLATLPAASSRVASLVAGAKQGDAGSKAVLTSLCEECCPDCSAGCGAEKACGQGQGACDQGKRACGQGCDTDLVARIKTLEASAANGCAKSAAKLVRIEAKLSGVPASKPMKKKSCGGCGGGCPGQQ